MDEQTVETIEFSAPRASLEDLSWLQDEFNADRIFKSYTDQEREDIFARLQQIRGLIPGLASFHCNIKYVSAVVGSLRSLLSSRSYSESIHSALKKIFRDGISQTRSSTPLVTDNLVADHAGEHDFDRAYRSLVVWGMRNYAYVPWLCNEDKALEQRKFRSKVSVEPDKLYELASFAQSLGFVSAEIDRIPYYSMIYSPELFLPWNFFFLGAFSPLEPFLPWNFFLLRNKEASKIPKLCV